MRKTAKDVLANALKSHLNSMSATYVPNAIHVINGDHLSDNVVSGKGCTYKDHINEYTSHMFNK